MTSSLAQLDTPQPAAWMGYGLHPSGGFLVRVCAYCPDKAEADRLAHAAGLETSHGICTLCYALQLKQLLGEQDE